MVLFWEVSPRQTREHEFLQEKLRRRFTIVRSPQKLEIAIEKDQIQFSSKLQSLLTLRNFLLPNQQNENQQSLKRSFLPFLFGLAMSLTVVIWRAFIKRPQKSIFKNKPLLQPSKSKRILSS
jgi:hypothetical protein